MHANRQNARKLVLATQKNPGITQVLKFLMREVGSRDDSNGVRITDYLQGNCNSSADVPPVRVKTDCEDPRLQSIIDAWPELEKAAISRILSTQQVRGLNPRKQVSSQGRALRKSCDSQKQCRFFLSRTLDQLH